MTSQQMRDATGYLTGIRKFLFLLISPIEASGILLGVCANFLFSHKTFSTGCLTNTAVLINEFFSPNQVKLEMRHKMDSENHVPEQCTQSMERWLNGVHV